jgi:hypothetical protein
MRFDYVAQVKKVLGCAKFGEADVSHYPVDLDPVFLALGPFLLDFLMGLLSHFRPIFGRFLYAIKVDFF